ncbi:MAG: efflux RND transporter permease subunit [Vicinamibacterales bacterium]
MKLADISVRNPVFAVMLGAALILLGAFSYEGLGLDLMPRTDSATVSVSVSLPGASAEEIETQVTKTLEDTVNTISGIDELRATSNQGNANVTINFTLERDIESATQDVRDKVAPLSNRFGRDARPPVVTKADPDAAPIFTFQVYGPRAPKELSEIAEKQIKQELETIKDVAAVSLFGNRNREIQLLLNADRMNAYGLTVDAVRNAVQRQNVEVPGGQYIAGPAEVQLRTMGRIRTVEDFNRIIITYRDGSAITFGDVGHVTDGIAEIRQTSRIAIAPEMAPQTSISMQIRKQSGTNTVEVVDRVVAKLELIKATLPPDVQIQLGSDQSRFIRKSFEAIEHHLVYGGLLASVVVFLFIRNLKVTLIAALAIPVSIIGTFTVMKALGFTLNNMTMLALSLCTGIVIDDAIVVLENIFRFIEEKGVTPREAAADATSEIGLAVMATTLSLVVIFVPVAFMTGQIGRYFYSFGITSAAAILISMFVSFTMTPALCATWLKKGDVKSDHSTTKTQGWYAFIDRIYGRMLVWSLAHRPVMVGIACLVVASAVYLYPQVGKELVPDDDQGEFSVSVRLPTGTTYARTEEFVKPIEQDMLAINNLPACNGCVDRILINTNSGGATYQVVMTDLETRTISQQELMRQTRQVLNKYKNARLSVSGSTQLSGASGGRGGGGNGLNILIQGPDIEQLQAYTVALMEKIRTIPGVVDADTSFNSTQPEMRVNVDRARAADLGASIDTLAASLRTLIGGEEVTQFNDGDRQYAVSMRLDEQFRNPESMSQLLVPAGGGRTIKVSDVAQLKDGFGPAAINRYNRQRQISVNANLDGTRPLGGVVSAAREKVEELRMKAGYQAVFGGTARTLEEASGNFMIAIVLAVAFIYMVLASQFNSFVHPFTIMTALPLSLPAGLLALMAFGMTLNVYSAIGMMMLFGIVKKNSILQVDYTNTLREQGMPRDQAIITANHVRLRPILMTTIAIVAGMLPIAFGRGSGAGSRASMAVTIIGGQVLCLLLTLLVTPVVYSYFDDLREWSPAATARKVFKRRGKPEQHVRAEL